jgi:hypothetical protein
MRFIKQRKSRVSILILAFTLMMQLYAPGAALCLEADGNASIEGYLSGSCADTIPARDSGTAAPSPLISGEYPGGHCGPCLDIPLAESISKRDTHSGCNAGSDMPAQASAAYILPYNPYPQTRLEKEFTEAAPRRNALPGFIRTVILIC